MDFGISEQQQEVQALARKILGEQVSAEKLAAYDEYQAPRFDRQLWRQVAEAGLLGTAIDETYGGMGFGFTELALFIEECGRSIAPLPVIPHLVAAALPVQRFGDDALRQRWLPAAASGEAILTAGLTEPGNENPVAPLTRAVADGDGYRLSGVKTAVAFAEQAARILVAADTGHGLIVALVDPNAEGVRLQPIQVTTFEPQCEVALDNVAVAAGDILAGPERGAEVMHWIAEHVSTALCAHQLGAADHALRMTASYTAERKQFGVLIATFQAVGHRAADRFIDVECLRLTTYQAASRLNSGIDASIEVAIAKIWAGDCGHRVSYTAQHLHGGTGIDRDYPLWRYCLWLRHNEMTLGSSARQLAHLGQRIAAGKGFCA